MFVIQLSSNFPGLPFSFFSSHGTADNVLNNANVNLLNLVVVQAKAQRDALGNVSWVAPSAVVSGLPIVVVTLPIGECSSSFSHIL